MSDELRRAYATLLIKSREEKPRIFEGIISTPTPDHQGDILEPAGARFSLPMALLWNHKQDEPIGEIFEATVSPAGIKVKGRVAAILEPGKLKDRIDEVWSMMTYGLARGLSVGWKPVDVIRSKAGGLQAKVWKWVESSVVIVPANQEATILRIKALDAIRSPSESAASRLRPPVGGLPEISSMLPISEQLDTLRSELQFKSAELETLESSDSDGTLDEKERPKLDLMSKAIETLTGKISRLETQERAQAIMAKAVTIANPHDTRRSFEPRLAALPRVEVVNLPKGTRFTRYAMAIAAGKGSYSDTLAYAQRWASTTPEVITYIKANAGTITPGSPAWGSELAEPQTLESEFVELVRARAILGRVTNFADIPFNVRMVTQTGGSTVNWVGETAVKPVSELAFDEAEVNHDKMAGIVVLSNELVRLSTPKAVGIVQADLVKQIAQFMDEQFFDPTITVSAARPASITNGVSSPAATGTDGDALRHDFNIALATFDTVGTENVHIATTPALARGISLLVNAMGTSEFPTMTPNGGSLLGYPVLVSGNIPSGHVIFFKSDEIWLADDGRVRLDASNQATIDMAGGSSPNFSLWQRNCTGILAEREITWKKRRSSGVVAVIDTAAYAPAPA